MGLVFVDCEYYARVQNTLSTRKCSHPIAALRGRTLTPLEANFGRARRVYRIFTNQQR